MTNPLVYTTPEIPEGGKFKISPSSFAKFIESPHIWYRSQVLKEDEFTHSTSTVIGTIVHYCAEMVSKEEMVDQKVIDEYIDMLEINDNYDPNAVRQHYPAMAECLVNYYVLERDMLEAETKHIVDIGKGYFVGGTIDRLEGDKSDCMLVDYNT